MTFNSYVPPLPALNVILLVLAPVFPLVFFDEFLGEGGTGVCSCVIAIGKCDGGMHGGHGGSDVHPLTLRFRASTRFSALMAT